MQTAVFLAACFLRARSAKLRFAGASVVEGADGHGRDAVAEEHEEQAQHHTEAHQHDDGRLRDEEPVVGLESVGLAALLEDIARDLWSEAEDKRDEEHDEEGWDVDGEAALEVAADETDEDEDDVEEDEGEEAVADGGDEHRCGEHQQLPLSFSPSLIMRSDVPR